MRPAWIAIAVAASCSPKGKAEVTEVAMGEEGRRRELIEATLRVLDENPTYVDEFFEATTRHRPTLDRFLDNTAEALAQPRFAGRVARHLVANPPGLRRVMIATLDAAKRRPAAQQAIADAMEARADVAAAFLVDRPPELAVVSRAIVRQALAHPETKGKMTELVNELVE